MPATLTLFVPGIEPQEIEIAGSATIGRTPSNDIAITADPRVSRQHAVIRCINGSIYQILDLGSRNGTFVNGQQVVLPVTLQDGATITVGTSQMTFRLPPVEPTEECSDSTIDATILHQSVRIIEVAILVCDVRGFSSCSEQLQPNEVAQFIGRWFLEAGKIIERHGGKIDKFIGDAVLAYWATPKPEACASAFSAGIALGEAAGQMVWPKLGQAMRTAVALHHGKVSSGNVGVVAQRDATIMGDAVNTAFRLEAAMKSLGASILCSESFFLPIAPQDGFHDFGTLTLKGKSQSVRVYGRE